jgi:hypothetical protein
MKAREYVSIKAASLNNRLDVTPDSLKDAHMLIKLWQMVQD